MAFMAPSGRITARIAIEIYVAAVAPAAEV